MNVQLELFAAQSPYVASLSVTDVRDICVICNQAVDECTCIEHLTVPSIFPSGFDLSDERFEE